MRKYLILVLLICILAAGFLFWNHNGVENGQTKYRLAKLEKRDLVRSISATGTLSAVVTVDVGSQISGQISQIEVDYNSPVKKNQIIARLDPLNYEALVRQAQAELDLYQAKVASQEAAVSRAQAELASAESNLLAAKAAIAKSQASLKKAKQDMERSLALVKKDFIAKTDYDKDLTTYQETKAQLNQAQAQERAAYSLVMAKQASLAEERARIKEAAAQVRLKVAALDNRKVDLDYTIIRSPVDGVVINRAVDVGQTVAASLQAPVLFTIAQDLRDMEVAASVDESDIGSIKEGQEAFFTVDAFGTRRFEGRVKQIRKAAAKVQNVVTYTVIIAAANHDLSLLPGMTAEVRIVLQKRAQVLTAPNVALRFKPPAGAVVVSDAGQAVPTAGAGTGQGGSDPNRRINRLAAALNLTSEQQDGLKKAFAEIRQKMQPEAAGSFGPGAGSRRRAELRKKMESAILLVLTPPQRDKYLQLAKQRSANQPTQGTIYRLDKDGKLRAFKVMVGATDGSHSEVRGKGLKAGQEIVTGRL